VVRPSSKLFALSTAAALLVTAGSEAGQFRMVALAYNTTINPTSIVAVIEGQATYVGEPDSDDNHAFIQSVEYDSWQGGDGNAGRGFNVYGPFVRGQPLRCTDAEGGCPGRGYVPRRLCTQPQYFYRGRAGVTIYHQYDPEIDQLWGDTARPPCIPDSTPPCLTGLTGEEGLLPVVGGPQLTLLPKAFFRLDRTDDRDGFRYLMEEWAVLAVDRAPDGEVIGVEALAASSSAYASFRRDALVRDIADSDAPASSTRLELLGRGSLTSYLSPGRSVVLVVSAPEHPHNARWIPEPTPRLDAAGWVPSGEPPARVVVRADFAEDRSPISFEVLWTDRPLSRSELDLLRAGLGLEYASEQRHRAVLFAVLRLGQDFEIERTHTILPQCCCLSIPGCPPPPPQ
jgi:hypothetical protein